MYMYMYMYMLMYIYMYMHIHMYMYMYILSNIDKSFDIVKDISFDDECTQNKVLVKIDLSILFGTASSNVHA